jgi:uncharacterized NAD-dependent epimerase/dehydratase family protein
VLDSERVGEDYDGRPIVATVEEAMAFGPTTALVGVATAGGRFPPAWWELLKECARRGLDLENGLHERLTNNAELVELAQQHGVKLWDLREPPEGLNVPTGENLRVPATIVLTVGSDCAIGKMTMGLELDREAQRRGIKSVFVPTGQRSTRSSPISSRARRSSSSSKGTGAAASSCGWRGKARCPILRTRV